MRGSRPAAFWHQHHHSHWVILGVVAVLGILALFAANAKFFREYQSEQATFLSVPKEQSVTVRVAVDTGTTVRAFEGAPRGMTIAAALKDIAGLTATPISFQNGTLKEFLGVANTSSRRWTVFQNGVEVHNLTAAYLHGGDRILARYQ